MGTFGFAQSAVISNTGAFHVASCQTTVHPIVRQYTFHRARKKSLRKKKEAGGHRSLAATVRTLVFESENNGNDDDGEQEVPPAAESDGKKRKILVREALISVDLIKERDGMMLDYAGVTVPQFEMLFERLEEEVRNFIVPFMVLQGQLGTS